QGRDSKVRGSRLPKSSRTSSRDVEPRSERVERPVVGGHRAPGEAESCSQELAASVEHALLGYFASFDVSQSLIALTNAVSEFASPERVAGNHPTMPTKPTRPRPQCDQVSALTIRPVGYAARS